jgi:UDP-N-acetyl-D-glucosamine dehydrogenase
MKDTARLRRRVLSRQARIVVLGQGYVGLTVACSCADAGFPVVGIDVNGSRIDDLQRGRLSVAGVQEATFRSGIGSGRLTFAAEPDAIASADIVVICVPTPLRDQVPDLSYIEGGCRTVASRLKSGTLVVLESTTYPGTTEDLAAPILQTSGLRAGREFLLAYSPERIDPGNDEFQLANTPKIVGGLTPESTGMASLFYSQFVEKIVVVSSCRGAELAKLLENTFRHVNVALVNEMAVLCHEMGIDVWEVVDAAATKPFGFMPFYPGSGVGGHCIPLDPSYLAWQVRRDADRQFRILEEAQDINAQMPAYVSNRIGEALDEVGKPTRGANVLVLGISYKADVGDVRESSALKVMAHLYRRGARVSYHDPYVPSVSVNGTFLESVSLSRQAVTKADCVAIVTPHKTYDLPWIAENARLIFDVRNAFGEFRSPNIRKL